MTVQRQSGENLIMDLSCLATAATYRYAPLSTDGNIRLLRLIPDRDSTAPIRCVIVEYPLRQLGQQLHLYEALSYVWDSEIDKQVIYI